MPYLYRKVNGRILKLGMLLTFATKKL
jgi:hypothetical protein